MSPHVFIQFYMFIILYIYIYTNFYLCGRSGNFHAAGMLSRGIGWWQLFGNYLIRALPPGSVMFQVNLRKLWPNVTVGLGTLQNWWIFMDMVLIFHLDNWKCFFRTKGVLPAPQRFPCWLLKYIFSDIFCAILSAEAWRLLQNHGSSVPT